MSYVYASKGLLSVLEPTMNLRSVRRITDQHRDRILSDMMDSRKKKKREAQLQFLDWCHRHGNQAQLLEEYENIKRDAKAGSKVGHGWLGEIIERMGATGKVKPRALFDHYMDSGLDDLPAIYGDGPSYPDDTTKRFSQAAVKAESELKSRVKYLFNKMRIYEEAGFCYNVVGSDKTSYRFADMIVASEAAIYVLEMKCKYDRVNKSQLWEYIQLLRHHAACIGDSRLIFGLFVIPKPPSRCYDCPALPIAELEENLHCAHEVLHAWSAIRPETLVAKSYPHSA